jgi:single-strand DNA-binding protein
VDSAGRGVNSGILAGNITRDPEMRYAKVGEGDMVPVTTFGLAVNRVRSDDPDAVDFFDVVCWRELAEIVEENKLKGDGVLVEGRFQLDQWKNAEGELRSKTVFVADEVQFTTLPTEDDAAGDEVPEAAEDVEELEDIDDLDDLAEEPAPETTTRANRSRRSPNSRDGSRAPRGGAPRAGRGRQASGASPKRVGGGTARDSRSRPLFVVEGSERANLRRASANSGRRERAGKECTEDESDHDPEGRTGREDGVLRRATRAPGDRRHRRARAHPGGARTAKGSDRSPAGLLSLPEGLPCPADAATSSV